MLSTSEGNYIRALIYPHYADALCDTSHNSDIAGEYPDDDTIAGYEDYIVVLVNYLYSADMTADIVHLVVGKSVAAAVLDTVAVKLGALAVAVFGDCQESCSLADSCHAYNIVAVAELDSSYAVSGT